jgi:protein ImuB
LIIVENKNNQVLQLDHIAAKQGIKVGMGLASAIAHGEQLMVVEYDQTQESNRLSELAQWLYQVVADIILFAPNGLALETTNMLSLYGNMQSYWAQITQVLNAQQVHYQGALANTPTAARLLAKNRPPNQNLLSDTTDCQQQLGALAVSQLELSERHINQLQRVGIVQLKQLWQLSSKELGRRFGLELLRYLATIKGDLNPPLTHYQPPDHFHQYLELFHEINQAQVLLFPLKRMVQDMARFLLTHQWVVTSLTITLHYRNDSGNETNKQILINSGAGEYQAERWMRLIGLKIERAELTAPVVGISLSTGEILEQTVSHDDLFASGKSALTNKQLISILQAKVGHAHINRLQLQADHRPEKSFNDSDYNQAANADIAPLPKHRPTILLPQAQKLTESYTIIQGPERIRTAWWSNQGIYRDYFIATNDQGVKCWLFNEPEQGWFLQGYFC